MFQIGKNSTEDGEVRSKRKFSGQKDHELPLLSFASIAASTNHFSFQNKIGEGGFGPVYKVLKYYYFINNNKQIASISIRISVFYAKIYKK